MLSACGPVSGASSEGDDYYNYGEVASIVMDDVQCVGDESSIFDCPRSKKLHNCNQYETASVTCNQCEFQCVCTPMLLDATNCAS